MARNSKSETDLRAIFIIGARVFIPLLPNAVDNESKTR